MNTTVLHVFTNPNTPHDEAFRQHVDRFVRDNHLSRDHSRRIAPDTRIVLLTNLCGGPCCEERREAEARSFAAFLHIFQQTVGRPHEIHVFHGENGLHANQEILREVTPPVEDDQIRSYSEGS